LTKAGAGNVVLGSANTYSGGTIIKGGTLQMGVDYAIPSNSTLYVDTLGTWISAAKNTVISGPQWQPGLGSLNSSTGMGN